MVDKNFIGLDKPDITRFESYLPTAFSSELTLLQKVNKIIQDLNRSFDLTNEMVDYLNWFIEMFDEKLYETLEDVLNVWVEDGRLADVVRLAISEEVIEARTDYLGKKYGNLKERLDDEKKEVIAQLTQLAVQVNVSDDIQLKLNSLSDGKSVYFVEGVHLSETLLTLSDINNFKIFGNNSTLKFNNLSQGALFTNCNNFIIENLIIDGNETTTKGIKFKQCNNITIKNVTLKNIKPKNVAEGYLHGFDFLGCKDVVVENCEFINIDATTGGNRVARAIQVENDINISSQRITIKDCTFDTILPIGDGDAIHFNQQSGDGITKPLNGAMYATIENCTFIDCAKRGIKCQSTHININNCKFYDVNYLGAHDSAITLFYDNCKVLNCDIKYKDSYRGIFVNNEVNVNNIDIINNRIEITGVPSINQDAISIGTVNDVYVYSKITITNNKIFGSNYRYSIYVPHANNVIIDGNYIESGVVTIGLSDQSIYFTENIKIINNRFSNVSKNMISLSGSNVLISDNYFYNCNIAISLGSSLTLSSDVLIKGNVFDSVTYGVNVSNSNITKYMIINNIFKNIVTKDLQLNGTNHVIENNIYDKGIGGSVNRYLQGSIVWDPISLNNGEKSVSADINVGTGASVGDFVLVSPPYIIQGLAWYGYVQSSMIVKIVIQNNTGSTIDLASGTWKVKVIKS